MCRSNSSRRARWGRLAAINLLVLALLPCLTGCPPAGVPPVSARQALSRVNDNLAKLRDPLSCRNALVSFQYRDQEGKTHRFIGHPAALIFQPPRCLYFNVKSSVAGGVARVGSNDEAYWLWIESDVNTMWWGRWDSGVAPDSSRLPLPPSELLSALALQPLTEQAAGGSSPALDLHGGQHRLLYPAAGANGAGYIEREVVLDRSEPYQPLEIVQRRPDGRIAMHAWLSQYRRVGPDGPYTPRKYVVIWPIDGAEMRLDILSAEFRADQPPFCEFPTNPPVRNIERIDEAPAGGQRAAGARH